MAKYKATDNLFVYAELGDVDYVSTISSGEEIEVSEISQDWYHYSGGWVYGLTPYGMSVLEEVPVHSDDTDGDGTAEVVDVPVDQAIPEVVTPAAAAENPRPAETPAPTTTKPKETLSQSDLNSTYGNRYSDLISSFSEATGTYNEYIESLDSLSIKNVKGIQGMPYQYMSVADTRVSDASTAFGRKYAEKIVSRMPLLLVTPGTPEFLSSYNAAEKQSILGYALTAAGGQTSTNSDIDGLLNREGRYYCLKPDWPNYYQHLNPIARMMAEFLDIQNETVYSTSGQASSLRMMNWENYYNNSIHSKIAYRSSIAFYIHSDTQIQESFNNNTTESQLAGKINGLSDMGREINFLLGTAGAAAGVKFDQLKQENLLGNAQNMKDATGKLIGNNSMINSLVNNIATVITGGKIMFPEIWADSQFSRSYDINMKLTTPDCDKLSWFLNIGLPLAHWICFAAPRQAGPNGYISPFLVRAFYKGMFNCDMGIITNLSISKGHEGGWTKEGLPTTIDLSVTVKDLYSVMSITSQRSITQSLMNNIGLLDYLANLCGVNINEPDIKRTIDMYLSLQANRVADTVKLDIAGGLDQWATNKILGVFRRG